MRRRRARRARSGRSWVWLAVPAALLGAGVVDHQRRAAGAALCSRGSRRSERRCSQLTCGFFRGSPPVVALAAGGRRAVARGLAGERPRAGRGSRRADRARLPRCRVGHRDGRARMVDPRRSRLCSRRSTSSSSGERRACSTATTTLEHVASPDRRRDAAPEPPAGDLRLGATWAGSTCSPPRSSASSSRGGASSRAAVDHRDRRRACGATPLRHVDEVAATVPVLAGLAFAAVDARRSRLGHPLEPARARGGPRGDRGGGA